MSSAIPPPLPKRDRLTRHHDQPLEDPYYWLRAENWQEVLEDTSVLDPEIAAAIAAENRYSDAMLSDTRALQQELVTEMRSHMLPCDADVPMPDGPYVYYWRYQPDHEHPVFARVPDRLEVAAREALLQNLIPEGEQLLLDGELESQAHEYFDLGDYEISPDHRYLAWTADCGGAEKYSLFIRDLATGKDLADTRESMATLTWLDNRHVIYVLLDAQHRARHVRCLALDSAVTNDRVVYDEPDPAFEVTVGRLRSGRFVEIVASRDTQDEVRLLRTGDTALQLQLVQERCADLEYSVDHYQHQGQDRLVVLTNDDESTDFKLMWAPVNTPARAHWQPLEPHRPGELLLWVSAYRDWLVWIRRVEGLECVYWMDDTGKVQQWQPALPSYSLYVELMPVFDEHRLRISVESPVMPEVVYELALTTAAVTEIKRTTLPSGHDPEQYLSFRTWAVSHDQVRVPVTCIRHRDTPLDGSAPAVLEVYASYGASLLAEFSSDRLVLLDRGYVYALAHARGGQELGRDWYYSARGKYKPNTFHDTVAVADHLVDSAIANPAAMTLVGRSAGGLAVGAIVNNWPKRFTAAIADVPFVDVLQTMLDDSLPLTPNEWTEWGNPLHSADDFATIAAYSPYDNIKAQAYPALYVTAGLTDPRVGYWEPLKWVTRLRELGTGAAPIALHTFTGAGHFGAAGRFAVLQDQAREFAFILKIDDRID